MVWFKAWLEIRPRALFTGAWLAFFVGVLALTPAPAGASLTTGLDRALAMTALPAIFVPLWLAGSGVRTQAGFGRGATRGIHGSTHFTLSLPVTRTRLVLVRSAVGMLVTAGVAATLVTAAWLLLPALRTNAAPADALRHIVVVVACGLAFYGLSTLVATLFRDDVWHMWSTTLAVMVLWAAPVRRALPPMFDILRPLTDASPLVTHALPWTAVAVAALIGGLFLLAAVRVAEAQEY